MTYIKKTLDHVSRNNLFSEKETLNFCCLICKTTFSYIVNYMD